MSRPARNSDLHGNAPEKADTALVLIDVLILLDHLKARRLVLAGIAADICVYFTAQDAFLRDYDVCVPSDGIAAQSRAAAGDALKRMRKFFKVRTARCRDVAWKG